MRDTTQHWQKILANGFSSAHELLEYLNLPAELGSHLAEKSFKTQIPRRFAEKMERNNPNDPLLLQVLASAEELTIQAGFELDPLQERNANPIPGLIHKYAGRVLLTLTGVCAINCRFCFRRHFPYEDNNPGQKGWQKAVDYIAADPSIHEVILSGGDPLLASDKSLALLLDHLASLPHVQTIRFHTRVPIVLPERIQANLLSIVDAQRFHIVMVLHCNHPKELDIDVQNACLSMKKSGWVLLNQSVLLKDVNHQPNVLIDLSKRLFDFGVLPYYLHLLDPVQGAHHFDIPLEQALDIHRAIQSQLPGYLVPRLVREQPEMPYKSIIAS
ncbi:MAG: EF-P beta-lysylation protein EpmB [Legionella sp.]|nr:MAG: EF-P beta-lysylation protein EpmB [Legionella sp.]